MSPALFTETVNAAANSAGAPRLSVLVPFYRDDARALLSAFEREAGDGTEMVLFDAGCPDERLNAETAQAVLACPRPARLVTARSNLGRAGARNALARRARGAWLLYLDADMVLPAGFFARWQEIAGKAEFDAAFGGFDLIAGEAREHRVHAALARAGDVAPAAARTARGASAVCSSNLLVRAGLMRTVPFDEGFTGWGWEDVDWAVRASKAGRLVHVDNPAVHAGLQPVEGLLSKFAAGGANFARFLVRNPEMSALPGARAAALVKRTRLASPVRRLSAAAARSTALPVRLRVLALKLYRAACAAEALS